MYVTVHRGTQQIGGNLVEISTDKTRLLFDAGTSLPPLDGTRAEDTFALEGLTCGTPAFDQVFLSHHHNDHCGLLRRLLPGIPVSAGMETRRILNVIADFTGQPRPEIGRTFQDGQIIQAGDILVTPIAVEHSARDSYMFLIQATGQNVLYTGDFRAADQAVSAVRGLLGEGNRLDLLITEGTNIRRETPERHGQFQGEEWIARRAAGRMRLYEGTVFVLCSAANEDRVQAISRAAAWSGRTVWEDLFQWAVRGQGREDDRKPGPLRRFVAYGISEQSSAHPYFEEMYARRALVGAETLAATSERNVIFIRRTMLPFMEKYMNARPPEQEKSPLLLYSMWEGYKQTEEIQHVFDFCKARGISVESLHTSGHAGRDTLQALVDGLAPAALLPIHCEAADREAFSALHGNCLMAQDGERVEV